jgi:plasmid stabilization system protein ParE
MKLIFAPEAAEDIENIYRYYVERNENYAVELYNQIIEEAELLQSFPHIAQKEQILEEYPEEYRSLIVWRSYKLVYFVENEAVNVVAVFDCRQNPRKLKKDIRKFKGGQRNR